MTSKTVNTLTNVVNTDVPTLELSVLNDVYLVIYNCTRNFSPALNLPFYGINKLKTWRHRRRKKGISENKTSQLLIYAEFAATKWITFTQERSGYVNLSFRWLLLHQVVIGRSRPDGAAVVAWHWGCRDRADFEMREIPDTRHSQNRIARNCVYASAVSTWTCM